MASPARKCATLSLKRKVEIIESVAHSPPSKKKKDITEEFSIPLNTLSTILKDKERYLQLFYSSPTNSEKQRQKPPEKGDLDSALFMWFKGIRDMNIPVSGPMLTSKAESLATELGYADWKCGGGWIHRFKTRHNIVFHNICGEAGDVCSATCEEWKESKLPMLIKDKSSKDVFNTDETGVFWRLLPNKTLCMKGETCTGGKMSKERVTVLTATNMDGSEKLPLLVIGKFENPRCFKGVKTLPVSYKANKKAWMTSSIFSQWVTDLDRKMRLANRQIVLFMDNCPAHPHISELKAVTLHFFPPNTTSRLQPCDQGIIWQLKYHYRKALMQKMINHIHSGEKKEDFGISLLDALHLLRYAWNDVTPSGIANCFSKTGFKDHGLHGQDVTGNAQEDVLPEVVFGNIFERIRREFNLPENVSPQDYAAVDSDVFVADVPSDKTILESVQLPHDATEEIGADVDDQGVEVAAVSHKAAFTAADTIRNYLQQHPGTQDASLLLDTLQQTIHNIVVNSQQQTKITDYFRK